MPSFVALGKTLGMIGEVFLLDRFVEVIDAFRFIVDVAQTLDFFG